MNLEDLHRTTPEAEAYAVGKLKGYTVDFSLNSYQRNGGVADLVAYEPATIYGVLWKVPNFKSLDKRECAPLVYERISIAVELETGEMVDAQTYVVRHKENPVKPADDYISLFDKPALAVPNDYLDELRAYASSLPWERKVSPDWRVETELPGERKPTTRTFYNPWEAVAVFRNSFVLGGSSKLYHQSSRTLEWDSIEDLDKLG